VERVLQQSKAKHPSTPVPYIPHTQTKKGRTLASCGADKTVRLWAAPPAAAAAAAAAETSSPPPPAAAAAAAGARFECAAVLEGVHTKTVRSVDWAPCGRRLATAGFDGVTAVWRCSGGAWESVSRVVFWVVVLLCLC
jgi:WD40 repeat protein